MTAIIEDVQNQAIDSELIVLFDLEYASGSFAYFFPAGLDEDLTEISFRDEAGNPNSYAALPLELEDFDVSSDGAYSRPTMSIANLESVFSTEIGNASFESLIGRRITKRTTLKKYLVGEAGDSTPPVEFPKITYVIDRIKEKSVLSVKFELAAPFDLAGIRLPRRVIVGGACPWKYTGASSRKYDDQNLIWTDADEIDKEGGCDWRRDSILTIDGTDYTVYMSSNDEYILPLSALTVTDSTTVSNYLANYYYSDTATIRRINDDGGFQDVVVTRYWQCLSATTTDPTSTSAAWTPVRIYETYSSTNTYYGYQDKRFNEYVLKDNRLWQVKRVTQTLGAHNTVEEGDFWTAGDVCGKKLRSCSMRFQAIENSQSQGGFDRKRDSRIALPFGGFPGVVQRR